jgi:tRNA G46 methylase TrmB
LPVAKAGGRFLEIGCGDGAFLDQMAAINQHAPRDRAPSRS